MRFRANKMKLLLIYYKKKFTEHIYLSKWHLLTEVFFIEYEVQYFVSKVQKYFVFVQRVQEMIILTFLSISPRNCKKYKFSPLFSFAHIC